MAPDGDDVESGAAAVFSRGSINVMLKDIGVSRERGGGRGGTRAVGYRAAVKRRGVAPNPPGGLLLDLHQEQWPLEPCHFVGATRGADCVVETSVSAPHARPTMDRLLRASSL